MKKFLLRFVVYVLTIVLVVGSVAALGYSRTFKNFYGNVYDKPISDLQGVELPVHDPNKQTVAVLLGDSSTTTEDYDFLIPYSLFSMNDAYNVYAVSPDKKVKSLSGGLEVVPHYSFEELDRLLGKGPDIIVVPYIPIQDEKGYQPVREYIQKHANATVMSICGGSQNLADTGLLKGKTAVTHWQATGYLRTGYPDTKWLDDQRYVPQGNIVTSAGQLAGVDGALYVISQKLGEPAAAKVANEIHYPTYQLVQHPTVDPFLLDFRFATYILNDAFQWNKTQMGVLLYNGMDELALSSLFDSFADTGTTKISTISSSSRVIVTKHHLNLLARYQMRNAPSLDKMIVTGGDAKTMAADDLKQWSQNGQPKDVQFMHADAPDRFVFEAPLEELAKQEDLLTAKHAVKRLEYRGNNIKIEGQGNSLPYETYSELLLTLLLAVLIAVYIDRRFILKKQTFKSNSMTINN